MDFLCFSAGRYLRMFKEISVYNWLVITAVLNTQFKTIEFDSYIFSHLYKKYET